MALNPLDTTTVPAASQARRIQGLEERIGNLEANKQRIFFRTLGPAELLSVLKTPGRPGDMFLTKSEIAPGEWNYRLYVCLDTGEWKSTELI